MTMDSIRVARGGVSAKAQAKEFLNRDILASRKLFGAVLTPQFAQCFGVKLDKELTQLIYRDLIQQTRRRKKPLLEVLLDEQVRTWFVLRESALLIFAVRWYKLAQRYGQRDYDGTERDHRRIMMVLHKHLLDLLEEQVTEANRLVGTSYQERIILENYRVASGYAFRSFARVETELGLREAPKSRRQLKFEQAPQPSPQEVDFSQTA
jgi:hypothetical protein